MESLLITRLSTLSHPHRMAVFKLLMRRYPDQVPAGEIAQALALKSSTASVYLSALTKADLISQQRDGTRLLYSVNLDTARNVVSELFVDCCRGRADLCPPPFSDVLKSVTPIPDRTFNVLFLCTGNSARSLIAEVILRDLAGGRFTAFSAGTAHRSAPNPFAVEVLSSKGHDVSLLHPKNITEFQRDDAPKMDFVFTVCDRAANEDCPTWPGQPISGHWGMPDPVKFEGTDVEKRLAFHQTYTAMHNRLTAFTALPLNGLTRSALQNQIDEIGKQAPNRKAQA
jgi:protein-tyrosine-phosphatase/DNA-binding transcriptional ArsR family regulator